MNDTAHGRRYRFAPLDQTGWILGLGPAQCLAFGGAIVLAAFALTAGLAMPVALVPVVGGAVFAFARVGGRTVRDWSGIGWSWYRLGNRRTWCVPMSTLGDAHPLPPFLEGIELIEVAPPEWIASRRVGSVGLVTDPVGRSVTVVMRVVGREFALASPDEQDRLVLAWGEALAACCRERHPVARLSWSEHAAPAGLDEHRAYLDDVEPVTSGLRADYVELVATAGPLTVRHEVLLAITIDEGRVRVGRDGRRDPLEAVSAIALEEARLLTSRLEAASLVVEAPCTPEALRTLLQQRLGAGPPMRRASRDAAAPVTIMGTEIAFGHARVDMTWHRSYWIAAWPRLEVPADWIAPVVMHAHGIRTLAMIYEPVPLSRSQRGVDRDATKLAADEEQRRRGGFRVGARQRRAQHEVLAREQELVQGYAELHYSGFVTISAPDLETLERDCAEYEQAAARSGLELRALVGQQDLGLGATLPIGRYPARRSVL